MFEVLYLKVVNGNVIERIINGHIISKTSLDIDIQEIYTLNII
jgi:hypothetical protein